MSLTVRREDAHLVLEVVDDGIGFEPGSVAGEEHLGLRTARSLVEEHGGTMEVESGPGSGTIVRVEVPLA
jgi:signal transduction histidine kinase